MTILFRKISLLIMVMMFVNLSISICQTHQTSVFSSGTNSSQNSSFTNFGTLGQPLANESQNSSFTNREGFIQAQFQQAETLYVSDSYDINSQIWGFDHFDNLDGALFAGTPDAKVIISGYDHTGDVDMTGHDYEIGENDFFLDGALTGGLIKADNTGKLVFPAVQNSQRTFPVTDGTNDFTVRITPLAPATGDLFVKLNPNKSHDNAVKSPITFWDIYGSDNLNATVVLRLDKAALAPETIPNNFLMRIFNGSRYVPIPRERVSIAEYDDYYEITITGMNFFYNNQR